MVFVEEGPLVGVQLSVIGDLSLDDFSCSMGWEDNMSIGTLAVMRQPHNAWLCCYAFDEDGTPVANFCGHDNLNNGLSEYVKHLKKIYK